MFIIKTLYFLLFCALTYALFCGGGIIIESWCLANNPLDYVEAISKTLAGIFASYCLLGLISFCLYMVIVIGTPRKKSFLTFLFAYMSVGFLILDCLNFYKPGFKEEINLKLFLLKGNIRDLFNDKNKLEKIDKSIEEFDKIDKEEYVKKIPDSLVKALKSILKGLLFLVSAIVVGLIYLILGFEGKDKSIGFIFPLIVGSVFMINSFFFNEKVITKIINYIIGIIIVIPLPIILYAKSRGFL